MMTLRFTIEPLTDFGTPLAGDTLFGHLCWAARERQGEAELARLLDGYTEGHPFVVTSDAFPASFVPKPTAPDTVLKLDADPAKRKETRSKAWLPVVHADLPLAEWIAKAADVSTSQTHVLTQNTINRYTGTTGRDAFAPRQVDRIIFAGNTRLDLYVVADSSRIEPGVVRELLEAIGNTGFGRDASTGLGKYRVVASEQWPWPIKAGRFWLTLAPCAPDASQLDAAACHYQPLTRFGRHGSVAAVGGATFKRPILLARTGALLATRAPVEVVMLGTGLGGERQPLSAAIPATVQQGYAPVVPLNME